MIKEGIKKKRERERERKREREKERLQYCSKSNENSGTAHIIVCYLFTKLNGRQEWAESRCSCNGSPVRFM